MSLRLDVITLFPGMFDAVTQYGVTGKANRNDIFQLSTWNPRDFTRDNYRTIDDSPYGGGPGMVMMTQPLDETICAAKRKQAGLGISQSQVIFLTPQGKRLDQALTTRLSTLPGLILLCGRYEGVDERLIKNQVDMEISIGDYVISGGELAAMVLIDSIVRLLPGTLGDAQSANQESFSCHLLDFPHYTRPEVYKGDNVPKVLISGNHAEIERWRLQQALGRTWLRRPDLLAAKIARGMTKEEERLLEEFKLSNKQN